MDVTGIIEEMVLTGIPRDKAEEWAWFLWTGGLHAACHRPQETISALLDFFNRREAARLKFVEGATH